MSDFNTEPKMRVWRERLREGGCELRSLHPLKIVHKAENELLFAFLEADVRAPDGHKLPSIVVVRGDVCLVTPLVRNRQTGEERFVMIKQYRIGHGQYALEFPAGMLDRHVHDPRGVAAQELEEETGLHVDETALFPLNDAPLFTSPGLLDEGVYYFGCVIELGDEAFSRLEGSRAGHEAEDEHITVTLKTPEQAKAGTISLQARLALHLFDEKRRER